MTHPDTDTLAGVTFPDPYRWLEGNGDAVRRWQREQAELASAYVKKWPHFERLRDLVARFTLERLDRGSGMPRYVAGRWFRAEQSKAIESDAPLGAGRVLFDSGAAFLSWISPSPDGRLLALGVCEDGSEKNTIRLLDVASGGVLAGAPTQALMDNWTGGVHWLPDSSGFFFTGLEQCVYLHRHTTVRCEIPWVNAREFRMVVVSRDGRYAVALERLSNVIPVAIAGLAGDGPLQWRPFITGLDGTVAGHICGDQYIAVTDVGAPRGRLVAIPLEDGNPNDPSRWRELVGESEAVLRSVTPVGERLYLSEYVDTYSRVRIVSRHGKAVGEVPLPGRGALGEPSFSLQTHVPRGHPDRFVFIFSSLSVSQGIYCHAPGESQVEVLRPPQVSLEGLMVEDLTAVSADGTRVTYHVVRRPEATGTQPTLIYAYGGFNAPLIPQFPGTMAAFIAAGGVYVHAHIRGGGEYGLDWWRGGQQRNKQNGYDDLYAVAEDLMAGGRATPSTLALMGGSNGGLMAGVAITQRPELWKVVVPRVPMLDLIGACRDSYGRMCVNMEYADVEDPAEVRRLATFSPYHLIKQGVRYPAVFIDAGDTDPRCPPWHARKFAACLQRVASEPVLLHVWENVGHGWATDKNLMVLEHTEWLAFVLQHLGMEV